MLEIPQPRSCCSQAVLLLLVFTVPFISKYILLSLQVTAPLQLFSLKILPAVGKPQKCSSRYMHQLVKCSKDAEHTLLALDVGPALAIKHFDFPTWRLLKLSSYGLDSPDQKP